MSDMVFEAYMFHCVRRRPEDLQWDEQLLDRKSTRLNSSHT